MTTTRHALDLVVIAKNPAARATVEFLLTPEVAALFNVAPVTARCWAARGFLPATLCRSSHGGDDHYRFDPDPVWKVLGNIPAGATCLWTPPQAARVIDSPSRFSNLVRSRRIPYVQSPAGPRGDRRFWDSDIKSVKLSMQREQERPASVTRWLRPIEASARLGGADRGTLMVWANDGHLTFYRTSGGHYRYEESSVDAFAGRWLKLGEAASRLGVDKTTVVAWADQGWLSWEMFGSHRRYSAQSVDSLASRLSR